MGPQANAGWMPTQPPAAQPFNPSMMQSNQGQQMPAPTLPASPMMPAKPPVSGNLTGAQTTMNNGMGGQQTPTGNTTIPKLAGLIQKALDRGVHVSVSMPIGGGFSPKNLASPDYWSKQVASIVKPPASPQINYHPPMQSGSEVKGAPPSGTSPITSTGARNTFAHSGTAINYTP